MEIVFANDLHAISAKTTTFAFRRIAIDEDALLLFGWYHGIVVDREDNLVVGGVDVVCDSGVETCLACVLPMLVSTRLISDLSDSISSSVIVELMSTITP